MTETSTPPRMLRSPLTLKAITIRGRGPYLHGARLDIRPLTILCGANGSGKSIWTELMRDMWSSLVSIAEGEQFPWWGLVRMPDGQSEIDFVDRRGLHAAITAAAIECLNPDDSSISIRRQELFYDHPSEDDLYGPPGTIGFEIEATQDCNLLTESEDLSDEFPLPGSGTSITEQFLRSGKLVAGSTIRIRWSQLRENHKNSPATSLAGLTELLEITLDGHATIRLSHKYGVDAPEESGDDLPADHLYFVLESSPSFWGSSETNSSAPVQLGVVNVSMQPRYASPYTPMQVGATGMEYIDCKLNELSTAIFKEVIYTHFFPIGPIREIHYSKMTETARVSKRDARLRELFDRFQEEISDARMQRASERLRLRKGITNKSGRSNEELTQKNLQEEEIDRKCSEHELEILRKYQIQLETLDDLDTSPSDPSVLKVPLIRGNPVDEALEELPKSNVHGRWDAPKDDDAYYELQIESSCNGSYRYVGEDGRFSQELWARYAYCLMREPSAPYAGQINNQFVNADFTTDDVNCVVEAIHNLPYDVMNRVLAVSDVELRDEWKTAVLENTTDNSLALRLLNGVLPSRQLFDRNAWPVVSEEAEMMLGKDCSLLPKLASDEVLRLNRLLLEEAFARDGTRRCRHSTGYLFETYFAYWMNKLTNASLQYGKFQGKTLDKSWDDETGCSPPKGGLTENHGAGSTWLPRGDNHCDSEREVDSNSEQPDLQYGVLPVTSPIPTTWGTMSTGFHQIAPIVLQAGLLQQYELMSVQNPEAHLHPSLQIKVAEFLMQQALAGKNIIIETHSDLFIRRIMRAVREEDIKQESVRIHFTHLENGSDGAAWKHAVLEQLEINDQGQIANWPEGFMDDDLEEANRWMAAIERQRNFDEDE